MTRPLQITIPTLVRIKEGALDRLGLYLRRNKHRRVGVLVSEGLAPELVGRAKRSLSEHAVDAADWIEIGRNGVEDAARRSSSCRSAQRLSSGSAAARRST